MKKILTWIIIALVLAVALFFILRPSLTGKSVDEEYSELDKFAQCLTDAGFVMYGTEWCPHCQSQKKMFGKSFKYIDYVDCDRNSKVCSAEKITGYPTWKINGESYPGVQQLERLASLSGCKFE